MWLEGGSGLIVFQGDGQPVAPDCRAWIHSAARHGPVWTARAPSFAAQIRYASDTASCRLRASDGSRYATVFDAPSDHGHVGADACRTLLAGGWVRQPADGPAGAIGPRPQPSAPASRDTPTLTVAHWSGREPSALYFSADAGNVVTDLRWTAWGRTLAFSEGESVIQSCVPSCAQGADMPARAYIVLSRPRHGRFTHLTEYQGGLVTHDSYPPRLLVTTPADHVAFWPQGALTLRQALAQYRLALRYARAGAARTSS